MFIFCNYPVLLQKGGKCRHATDSNGGGFSNGCAVGVAVPVATVTPFAALLDAGAAAAVAALAAGARR